jgi:hypothetical protein
LPPRCGGDVDWRVEAEGEAVLLEESEALLVALRLRVLPLVLGEGLV